MSIRFRAFEQKNRQKIMITRRLALVVIKLVAFICVVFAVNRQNKGSLLAGVKLVSGFPETSDGLDNEIGYRQVRNDYEPSSFKAGDVDLLAPAASGGAQLLSRQRLAARSELFNGNIGLRTDGTGVPRSLSNQYDTDDSGSDADLSSSASASVDPSSGMVLRNEIYLLEDKDYPKSLFEDYPRRVGQVSGITTLPGNDVAIFHRSSRHWTSATFDESTKRIRQASPDQSGDGGGQLIKNDTIMIIDGENGGAVASFGANLFYLPHSIASDQFGNLWVSDVARHQVMRLPASSIAKIIEQQSNNSNSSNNYESNNQNRSAAAATVSGRAIRPDIVLGEAFVPGTDRAHFCQPSEIAVSSNGLLVFVADGYCNKRVMVFTGTGTHLASFGEQDGLSVVHSLALIEERNLLCVADRENGRILCYRAGLDGDLARMGELVHRVNYPLGRVFAITSLSEDHLLVSSNQVGTNRYDLAILNPFTNELKIVWISSDLLEPHSLTSTNDRQAAYAADISEGAYKKVFKFNIIRRRN